MELEPRPPGGPVLGPRTPIRDREWSSFSAGDAIRSSFAIFGRHLPVLLLLAATFHAIPTWLKLVVPGFTSSLDESGVFDSVGGGSGLLLLLADLVFPLAFQALITFAVFRTLRGGPARYGESIALGIRRLPQALGTSLTISLIVLLPWFGLVLLVFQSPNAVVGLGLVWTIFAMFLSCLWFVAVQIAVVEGVNPLRAMSRSAFLTGGARWRLLGILLLIYALPAVLASIVEFIVLGVEDAEISDTPRVLLQAGFDVFFAGLQAVASVVVYHALRQAKEGVGLDELLAVFD